MIASGANQEREIESTENFSDQLGIEPNTLNTPRPSEYWHH